MRRRTNHKPLGTVTLILTAGTFLIMLTAMTLQGFLMYLCWRISYQANIPILQFWRPIPLLAMLSAVVGAGLTLLLSRIPPKSTRDLIEAINQLANGNFKVCIHLSLNREFERFSGSLNRMAQELENTELLRSGFINNFSHEFKTPIVSLRGFAKMLKNDGLTKGERDEYLDITISESNRPSQLSTNALNLSKIEKVSILSGMGSLDLSEEVRQSVLLLESKWQKKQLELFIDLDELEYRRNKAPLNQVWINLIGNAIEFSPQNGKIKLKLHKKKDQVVFQILDNGCDMDEDTKNRIFDRFYQGDSFHTTEGDGIGLTVVEKIIHLHRGQIRVISEADIGTTFIVNFPIVPPPSAPQTFWGSPRQIYFDILCFF